MIFIRSEKNGCTYTLNPDNNVDLMYAPMYADGSIETTYSGYNEVEWDMIEDELDVVEEAARCHQLLLEDAHSVTD